MACLTRTIISLIGLKTYSSRKKTHLVPECRQIPVANGSGLGEEPIVNSFDYREKSTLLFLKFIVTGCVHCRKFFVAVCYFFLKKNENVYSQEKHI